MGGLEDFDLIGSIEDMAGRIPEGHVICSRLETYKYRGMDIEWNDFFILDPESGLEYVNRQLGDFNLLGVYLTWKKQNTK